MVIALEKRVIVRTAAYWQQWCLHCREPSETKKKQAEEYWQLTELTQIHCPANTATLQNEVAHVQVTVVVVRLVECVTCLFIAYQTFQSDCREINQSDTTVAPNLASVVIEVIIAALINKADSQNRQKKIWFFAPRRNRAHNTH